jgi:hypothetical protein
MRCLTCGHDMVLMSALPAQDGFVQGFEQQTLQCPACGETEHRFVFKPAVTAAGSEMAALASPPDCIRVEVPLNSNDKDKSVPSAKEIDTVVDANGIGNGALAPSNGIDNAVLGSNGTDQSVFGANGILKPMTQSWGINPFAAVAKKKSSASDQVPTEDARAVTRANEFALEARDSRSANGDNASPERWLQAVERFRRYEADLNRRVDKSKKLKAGTTPALRTSDTGQPRSPQRAVLGPDRFDELWDGPIPDRKNGAKLSVAATSLAPLPRSLSLVLIETREVSRDSRGNKSVSKKMLEKLYNSLQRMLPSL